MYIQFSSIYQANQAEQKKQKAAVKSYGSSISNAVKLKITKVPTNHRLH